MRKQSGPSAVEVSSVDQLKAKLEKAAEHCIIGVCVCVGGLVGGWVCVWVCV